MLRNIGLVLGRKHIKLGQESKFLYIYSRRHKNFFNLIFMEMSIRSERKNIKVSGSLRP